MSASHIFNKAMFSEPASVSEEFFERQADLIFEKPENAKMGLRCWSTKDLSEYQKVTEAETADLERTSDAANVDEKGSTQLTETPKVADGNVAAGTFSNMDVDLSQLKQLVRATNGQFRLFFIPQQDSHSSLQITKEQLDLLMKECQMFPKLKEILTNFHYKFYGETEVGSRSTINHPMMARELEAPAFELAYIVRSVEFTARENQCPWSLRQSGVYHKFVAHGPSKCSTWLLAGPTQRLEKYVDSYSPQDPYGMNPFALHVNFLDAAIASWREYSTYLYREAFDAQVDSMVIWESFSGSRSERRDWITDGTPEDLSITDDMVINAQICLEHTIGTVKALMQIYQRYRIDLQTYPNDQTPAPVSLELGDDEILYKFQDELECAAWELKKARLLLEKTSSISRKMTCLSIVHCSEQLKALIAAGNADESHQGSQTEDQTRSVPDDNLETRTANTGGAEQHLASEQSG